MVAKVVSAVEPHIVAPWMRTLKALSRCMMLKVLADEVSLQAISISELLGPLYGRKLCIAHAEDALRGSTAYRKCIVLAALILACDYDWRRTR
jgi:hypothetical protein